ncbi:MAG: hypothetical protein FJW37_12345 [Acidobacteria bacterium]|nr:hypothetical protein [Acidobacteriota bacterium]
MTPPSQTSFFGRMLGAARLDSEIYEEIEADAGAFSQALAVVALSSISAGVGATGRLNVYDAVSGLGGGMLGWAIWAGLAYLIGGRLLATPGTRSNWGELLRTTGFATAPGILSILGVVPAFTGFIAFLTSVWILAGFVVAVRQALDYLSTWRAVAVCLAGWLAYAGILWVLVSYRVGG